MRNRKNNFDCNFPLVIQLLLFFRGNKVIFCNAPSFFYFHGSCFSERWLYLCSNHIYRRWVTGHQFVLAKLSLVSWFLFSVCMESSLSSLSTTLATKWAMIYFRNIILNNINGLSNRQLWQRGLHFLPMQPLNTIPWNSWTLPDRNSGFGLLWPFCVWLSQLLAIHRGHRRLLEKIAKRNPNILRLTRESMTKNLKRKKTRSPRTFYQHPATALPKSLKKPTSLKEGNHFVLYLSAHFMHMIEKKESLIFLIVSYGLEVQ